MERLRTPSPPAPARRAVILGASNVMRGLPLVVRMVREQAPSPVDILMATGHGRSYGMGSRVFGRELPAILTCGLWRDLRGRSALPTAALVTDVGNDILYGASAETILAWVGEAIDRLQPLAESVVLSGLPIKGIGALGQARYLAVRSIIFPRCRLSLAEVRTTAHTVHAGLRALAARAGAVFVEPEPSWYGLDPIHVRRAARPRAWERMLDAGPEGGQVAAAVRGMPTLRLLRPQQRRLFGIEQTRSQPSATLPDGTHISLY